MGVKTEALVVIAQENFRMDNGPVSGRSAERSIWKSLLNALNSSRANQPSNGSQPVSDHANGVKHRQDGNYSREDSMRMLGSNYNGPHLKDRERFKKK